MQRPAWVPYLYSVSEPWKLQYFGCPSVHGFPSPEVCCTSITITTDGRSEGAEEGSTVGGGGGYVSTLVKKYAQRKHDFTCTWLQVFSVCQWDRHTHYDYFRPLSRQEKP